VAGSETAGMVVTGLTSLLLEHPEHMEKVKQEVRSASKGHDDVTVASVGRLQYLTACIKEALPRCPPIPRNIGHQVRRGGQVIAGKLVPEDVRNTIYL
jgi:Cytochrome P450